MAIALHLDFETYSSLPISVGVENYMRAPDFDVTIVGWAFDEEPAQATWWPNSTLPTRVRDHINAGGIIKAWNARFEWSVLTYGYGLNVEHEQMDCTMERALAWGLPGKLGAAGEAMRMATVKDKTARDLMLQMGKPRKNGLGWHVDLTPESEAKMKALALYCARDVEAERALDRVVPMLSTFERNLSVMTARSNETGVLVDREAVRALRAAAKYERAELNAECALLTHGEVTSPGTQTAKLLAWLSSWGCILPNTTKEVIAGALASGVWAPDVRRVLEIRQLAAKSSLAKLDALDAWASSHDDRARSMFQFYGAGRTGRWAGRGPQPQNLPRPEKGLVPENVIAIAEKEPTALGLFYQAPLRAISGALRSCLMARPGHVLVSIDLAQIEARVLPWLAGQWDVLEQFRRGEDVYTTVATGLGSTDRQLGKAAQLSLGFGAGADKFQSMADHTYGVRLSKARAQEVVDRWRAANPAVRRFWDDLQTSALAAVGEEDQRWQNGKGRGTLRGVTYAGGTHDRIMMKRVGPALAVRKPNGGKLWYHNPRGARGDYGLDFKFDGAGRDGSMAWQEIKAYGGFLAENVTQAVARDIMAEAVLRCGLLPVMTVHDEIVWEVPEADCQHQALLLKAEVEKSPAWAADLPIASDMRIGRRYGK